MIIKTLSLSQLIYSASNLVVPAGIEGTVKTKWFKFSWKNKKEQIKRSGLYQDTSKVGLRMTDKGLMFKSLNLACIPRFMKTDKRSWCTVPNHFFSKMGGLNLILRCNYHAKHFNQLPALYKNILDSFNELKTLHGHDQSQVIILFNNEDILIGGRPAYTHGWFKKGVVSIKDLLNDDGNFSTFKQLSDKY